MTNPFSTIFPVDRALHDTATMGRIAGELRKGKIMVYPTETVYGIGCDAFNEAALGRVFAIKQRPQNKPLILLVRDVRMLGVLAAELPRAAKRLIEAFWPGPLTMVFRAQPGLSSLLTGGTGTIAVRQSPHPFPASLFRVFDRPLVSTSANISSQPPAVSSDALPAGITDKVDLIVDAGIISGTPSTVIDVTNERIVYIRDGAIKKSSIERLLYDRDQSI